MHLSMDLFPHNILTSSFLLMIRDLVPQEVLEICSSGKTIKYPTGLVM